MKKRPEKKKRAVFGAYFLLGVLLLYLILFFLSPQKTHRALEMSGHLLVRIIPALLLVILIMGMTNTFVRPVTISKYLGKESGLKGWTVAALMGIISHGPIYVWYPLLSKMRQSGMRMGLAAVFLYNRAIKIPLLPVMIYYFGLLFAIVLLIDMILASLIEGKIIDLIDRSSMENDQDLSGHPVKIKKRSP